LIAFLIVGLLHAASLADPCAVQPPLPAYSHNDYRNERPLLDALELGYRGVEVDLFREGDALLVGHSRDELQSTRTLQTLYLDPMRERLRQCGRILGDSTSFLLNIELKENDEQAFALFRAAWLQYTDLFHDPGDGMEPPVRAVLVGWLPEPNDSLRLAQLLGAQVIAARHNSPHIDLPVRLVTIDYASLRLTGPGRVPSKRAAVLAEARMLASQYNAPIRVHHAPASRRVYQWLLAEGVTLIGTNDLARTRTLLTTMQPQ